MNNGEKLASYSMACASLAALIVAIIELPSQPSALNILLAAFASVLILITVLYYSGRRNPRSRLEEEQRLRNLFPRICAFVDSIESIRREEDFQKLETQLDQLIEIEKKHDRSMRWKQMRDIEAIRGIALAKLVQKKRFKS